MSVAPPPKIRPWKALCFYVTIFGSSFILLIQLNEKAIILG